MTKKILKSIILLSVLNVLIASAIVWRFWQRRIEEQNNGDLKIKAELISRGMELLGDDYIKGGDFDGLRVTWFSLNGEVLYDSDGNIPITGREVDEAFEKGNGFCESRSFKKNRFSLGYAVRLEDGSVIRLSEEREIIPVGASGMIGMHLILIAVFFIVSVTAAKIVSKRIVRPINGIDLDDPKKSDPYPELAPLLDRIYDQNRRIGIQMQELGQSREQFNLITESVREGLVIADRKLTMLACNSGAVRLLEAQDTGVGRSIFSLNNSNTFRRCIQDAAGGRRSECVIKTEGGEREIIASPAKSMEIVNGIVVFIIDVTEKQQLEEMRREFTSNVSHELKTPLTTIYGISDMLAGGIVNQEDVVRFGGEIRSEASRLVALINDIVSLSKLDENAVPHENEDIDLYELASDIMERLKRSADEKSVKLLLRGVHVILNGNRTIFDEIIYNLCDNAIKYNCPGGVCEVKISHIPQKAIITVSDTGIGIPEEHIPRIFERFYRVDKSRSRKIKGTGLGLSIVKHGVMYHGGTVRAESVPGKGTVFTVELPICNCRETEQTEQTES